MHRRRPRPLGLGRRAWLALAVPVIAGSTRDEATLLVWMSHNLSLRPLRAEQYLERLEFLMGSRELAEHVAVLCIHDRVQ